MIERDETFNGVYFGRRLNRIAFPLGGIGAGMICIEGTGALSHFSLRHKPELFNEPCVFSAICIKEIKDETKSNTADKTIARVLEGPVPEWKIFGRKGCGNGGVGTSYGLPRFAEATFLSRFPFAIIKLKDSKIPLAVTITGWSPFIPGDADNSSLPVAGLEFQFTNISDKPLELVYSFNAQNFMATGAGGDIVRPYSKGFILYQPGSIEKLWEEGAFCATVAGGDVVTNYYWYRGNWFDTLTLLWNHIAEGKCPVAPDNKKNVISEGMSAPGSSLFVYFKLSPNEERTIKLRLSWYVPDTDLNCGKGKDNDVRQKDLTHKPWYASKFSRIEDVAHFWMDNYEDLRRVSKLFSECFYASTLPPEVVEAVATNLAILKSPTVLRDTQGRLWCWEGCGDDAGCCYGSCTHVWNYASAIPHLFPDLERTLRQTEFNECQDEHGHQNFRVPLPIRPADHSFHAAADGQLGGIMKLYRDWRISGNTDWLRSLWEKAKASLHYCIETWDPAHRGVLVEPHHNTYDVEFWGPDSMCNSYYLGALKAASLMGRALGEDVIEYESLYEKGRKYMEEELFNGEYFYQRIQWQELQASKLVKSEEAISENCLSKSDEPVDEGPKYQYGSGCLSDGIVGAWMAAVCGVGEILDREKVKSHLLAVYNYNLKRDLSEHANPQRPTFAVGKEGGLLLCTWPRGGKPRLPFPYSEEVWTGIEYQVASHLFMLGYFAEGLEIVRICLSRYDGSIRNPFDEYECGHWYGRALSSYALLLGLTGVWYDAVEQTLYLKPQLKGDWQTFFATETGFGIVGIKDGKPFVNIKRGNLQWKEIKYERPD